MYNDTCGYKLNKVDSSSKTLEIANLHYFTYNYKQIFSMLLIIGT